MGIFKSLKKEIKKQFKPLENSFNKLKKSVQELTSPIQELISPISTENLSNKRIDAIIKNTKHNCYYKIEHDFGSGVCSKDNYKIEDLNGNIKYKITSTTLKRFHHLEIYENNEKIGEIKRNLLARIGTNDDFLFEKRYISSVNIEKEEYQLYILKTSKSVSYGIKRKGWGLSYSKEQDVFNIRFNGKTIAKIYKPMSIRNNIFWLIGCDDESKEKDILIITTTLWNLVREQEN